MRSLLLPVLSTLPFILLGCGDADAGGPDDGSSDGGDSGGNGGSGDSSTLDPALVAAASDLFEALGDAACNGEAECADYIASIGPCLASYQTYLDEDAADIATDGDDCIDALELYVDCLAERSEAGDACTADEYGNFSFDVELACPEEAAGFYDACPTIWYSAFSCTDGDEIPYDDVCNGIDDCDDGSDEEDCEEPEPVFECANGESTPADYVCDGEDDCGDGSDEVDCPQFTCADGQTIFAGFECDGGADCADASDEDECAMFECGNRGAVFERLVCNGEDDCGDGSDEADCD